MYANVLLFIIGHAGTISSVGGALSSMQESLSFIQALPKMSMVSCTCNPILLRIYIYIYMPEIYALKQQQERQQQNNYVHSTNFSIKIGSLFTFHLSHPQSCLEPCYQLARTE